MNANKLRSDTTKSGKPSVPLQSHGNPQASPEGPQGGQEIDGPGIIIDELRAELAKAQRRQVDESKRVQEWMKACARYKDEATKLHHELAKQSRVAELAVRQRMEAEGELSVGISAIRDALGMDPKKPVDLKSILARISAIRALREEPDAR